MRHMLRSRDKQTGRENYPSPSKSVRISTFTRGALTDPAMFSQSLPKELRNLLYTRKCETMKGRVKKEDGEGGVEVGGYRRRQWWNGGRWALDNGGTVGREDWWP